MERVRSHLKGRLLNPEPRVGIMDCGLFQKVLCPGGPLHGWPSGGNVDLLFRNCSLSRGRSCRVSTLLLDLGKWSLPSAQPSSLPRGFQNLLRTHFGQERLTLSAQDFLVNSSLHM